VYRLSTIYTFSKQLQLGKYKFFIPTPQNWHGIRNVGFAAGAAMKAIVVGNMK
jgi:hypothetical protein